METPTSERTKPQPWADRLNDLHAFTLTHGRMPSASSPDTSERSLTWWVNAQRRAHKLNTLTPDRVAAMDEKVPGWQTGTFTRAWDATRQQVADFIRLNGNFPRQTAEDATEKRLARWIDAQRQAYRMGTLTPDRCAALEATEGWQWVLVKRHGWDTNLESWLAFTTKHGHRPTYQGDSDDEWRLYKWFTRQQESDAAGTLTPERRTRLDEAIPGWNSARRRRPSVQEEPEQSISSPEPIMRSWMQSLPKPA